MTYYRSSRLRFRLCYTCTPQDTLLQHLQAPSPNIPSIFQQQLPTAVTPTGQSVLMALRVAAICTERGTDIECYCVCCKGLGRAMQRGTDTECYCVCCESLGGQCREELILNVTVFVVRVWGGQCREVLYWMFLCLFQGLGRAMQRGTDTESYCVFSGSGEGNVERN